MNLRVSTRRGASIHALYPGAMDEPLCQTQRKTGVTILTNDPVTCVGCIDAARGVRGFPKVNGEPQLGPALKAALEKQR